MVPEPLSLRTTPAPYHAVTIFFPFMMFARVNTLTRSQIQLMIVVAVFMLLCCIAAAIGAVRNIITSFDSFTFA